MALQPIYRADIPRNVRDEVRVIIEPNRASFSLDVRVWEDARFGQVCTRVPTKQGVTLDARKIPEVIEALKGALAEAVRLGVLSDDPAQTDALDFSPPPGSAEFSSAMEGRQSSTDGLSGSLTHHKTRLPEAENARR